MIFRQILICSILLCGALSASAQRPSDSPAPGHVTVVEHGAAAQIVSSIPRNMSTRVKIYRVMIFLDNDQNARSAAAAAKARFENLFPGVPVYPIYESPYFKVSVGNCLTAEEATMLCGKVIATFDKAFITREDVPLSLFAE